MRFLLALALLSTAAQADDERVAIHGQATFVLQGTPGFRDPYEGDNSLKPDQRKETFDATAYIGVRGWKGLELWINPEVDQGFGLSSTLGVAGFPSAEAYKVGKKHPYVRLQRLFLRQTIDLGGDDQKLDPAANQLGGRRTADALIVTIGKFGVNDVFDTNKYAHDARHDVLNWALVDAGTFDYAADAWGYATGASAELYKGDWTLRLGGFNLSKIPNGEVLEQDFGQYQIDAEIEHRHKIGDHDGAVRITVFRNRGRFGRFDDALALAATAGIAPDTALVRRRMTRAGVSLNLEQAVSDAVGLFARAGLSDGAIEPYDFTDVDRTLSGGAAIQGKGWGRADDELGLALVLNGISASHRRYLAAGGYGVLVGDGRLPHYSPEAIAEAFYVWKPLKPLAVTLDYQLIGDPGYNRDRGPANVFAMRLHGEF